MLRTNLSTRPFYNERVVFAGIAVLVVLTVALSAFNAAQILSLTSRKAENDRRESAAGTQAAEYRERARTLQQALDREDIGAVQEAAREANQLIDRRAFSWTTLFNQFEETLPPDVRILSVAPQVDRDGRMLVAVTTIARRDEDLDAFIDRLEATSAFDKVISRQDETLDDGSTRAVLQGYYLPVAEPVKAASTPPASDSNKAGGNQTPANATPATGGPR